MTDFTEMELDEDIDELDEDELRATFSEFMDTHQSNVEAVDDLRANYAESVEGFENEIEDLEEKVSEFTQERAEEAAEFVNIPADLIVDRFSIDEIEQIIEEGEEFSESSKEPEEEEADSITTFANREEKGEVDKGGRPSEYSDAARTLLGQKMGIDLSGD